MGGEHVDYVRMGQLFTITVIVVMILHGFLLRTLRFRRVARRLVRNFLAQTQRDARRTVSIVLLLFLGGLASMCLFFAQIVFSLPNILQEGRAFAFIVMMFDWFGLLLSMDVAYFCGFFLLSSLWKVASNRGRPSGKEQSC